MPQVKFKATKGLTEYHGFKSDVKPEDLASRANLLDLKDGEGVGVCEADAKRLVADFPANFSIVKSRSRTTTPAKPKEEKGRDAAKKP